MKSPATCLPLLAILLLGYALRLYLLGESNIWYDEGLAVWAARQSPAAIAQWTAIDVHPPLYFWLLHGWRMLVGESEFAVRWLSAGVGVLTVAVVATLARRVVQGRVAPYAAIVAALYLATMRFHLWWSQEARMYALGGLLVALSLYFTLKLRERVTAGRVIAYLLVTAAALWTLYLLAFVLVAEGLYWLATLPQGRGAWRSVLAWAAVQAAVLASFAGWLVYAVPQMRQWSVQTEFDGVLFAELYAVLLTVGQSTQIAEALPTASVVMLLLTLSLVWAWRGGTVRREWLLPLLTVLVPPLVVYLATTIPRDFGYSPKPEARYLLPYAPAFAVLAGAGVAGLTTRTHALFRVLPAIMALLLVALNLWSVNGYFKSRFLTDDYRSITATLDAYWREGEAVLLHSDQDWPVFAYHWGGAWAGVTYTQEVASSDSLQRVYPLWENSSGLWLVLNEDAPRIDPARSVQTWLASQAVSVTEWTFGTQRLLYFARTAQPLTLAPTFTPPLYNRIGWEQPLTRYRPGMVAHGFVTITAQAGIPIKLELGTIASREITPATSGRQRLHFDVYLPPDAPAGSYRWQVQQGDTLTLLGYATILAATAPPEPIVAPPARPALATFGNPAAIALRAYEGRPATIEPGQTITLTLQWQAARLLTTPYKVFVHVATADDIIWAQSDSEPVGGTRPTTSWRVGELILDRHTLTLDPAAPPGERYFIYVGLYDPVTGARLGPVRAAPGEVSEADRLLLK